MPNPRSATEDQISFLAAASPIWSIADCSKHKYSERGFEPRRVASVMRQLVDRLWRFVECMVYQIRLNHLYL